MYINIYIFFSDVCEKECGDDSALCTEEENEDNRACTSPRPPSVGNNENQFVYLYFFLTLELVIFTNKKLEFYF